MLVRKKVNLRVEKGKLMRQMMIINMVLTLKAVKGVLLIKSILKIIEL